jgi:hypothetical protein
VEIKQQNTNDGKYNYTVHIYRIMMMSLCLLFYSFRLKRPARNFFPYLEIILLRGFPHQPRIKLKRHRI